MIEKSAEVLRIFVAENMGAPMRSISEEEALPGRGLASDRYALGTGAYSNSERPTIRHVTLISHEAWIYTNRRFETSFTLAETRRNIVTFGVDLHALIGLHFMIDEVQLRGIELCTPCKRPSKLADKPYFERVFDHRGGIRAEVVIGGRISVHHSIRLCPGAKPVIHGISGGLPLCDFDRNPPVEWHPLHQWLPAGEKENITCPACSALIG